MKTQSKGSDVRNPKHILDAHSKQTTSDEHMVLTRSRKRKIEALDYRQTNSDEHMILTRSRKRKIEALDSSQTNSDEHMVLTRSRKCKIEAVIRKERETNKTNNTHEQRENKNTEKINLKHFCKKESKQNVCELRVVLTRYENANVQKKRKTRDSKLANHCTY